MASPAFAMAIYKHPDGSFEKLTTSNYYDWSNSMMRHLKAKGLYKIVTREEKSPTIRNQHDLDGRKFKEDFDLRSAVAEDIIYSACSDPVRVYISRLDDPAEMWTELNNGFNPAASTQGRYLLQLQFAAMKPFVDESTSIDIFLGKLLAIHHQLANTDEELSDIAFRTQLSIALPKELVVIYRALIFDNQKTIEEMCASLLQQETIHSTITPATLTHRGHVSRFSSRGSTLVENYPHRMNTGTSSISRSHDSDSSNNCKRKFEENSTILVTMSDERVVPGESNRIRHYVKPR